RSTPALHSFPTRRSSDLRSGISLCRLQESSFGRHLGLQIFIFIENGDLHHHGSLGAVGSGNHLAKHGAVTAVGKSFYGNLRRLADRKSTRLNSSHSQISY